MKKRHPLLCVYLPLVADQEIIDAKTSRNLRQQFLKTLLWARLCNKRSLSAMTLNPQDLSMHLCFVDERTKVKRLDQWPGSGGTGL